MVKKLLVFAHVRSSLVTMRVRKAVAGGISGGFFLVECDADPKTFAPDDTAGQAQFIFRHH
jgi:hypothetical protein